MTDKLIRPQEGRTWAGVCAGLANYMMEDVILVRLIVVLVSLFLPVPMLLAYLVACLIIPSEEEKDD